MYQMVKDLRTVATKSDEGEVVAPTAEAYAAKKKADKKAENAKKGWQTVEDDGFGGSFGTFSPGTTNTKRAEYGRPEVFDQKATVKRTDV